MRVGLALVALFSILALLIQVYADVSIEVLSVETILTNYGINATYRSEVVNTSLLVVSDEPIYNVTIESVSNAYLISTDYIDKVLGKALLNTTIKIPPNASLGTNYVVFHVVYYTPPEPSEVCNTSTTNTLTLYACIKTNVSSSNISLYVYTYPYTDKELLVLKDGVAVLNTTIYSWSYYEVPGPSNLSNYLVRVVSPLGSTSLTLKSIRATPTAHELNIEVPIEVVARNVTSISLMLNPANNSLTISNTYRAIGQLVVSNITVNIYSGILRGNVLEWVLNESLVIPKLALGESKTIPIPWDLRHNPLVNTTILVCDDVHGCPIVNETSVAPLTQGCNYVVFKVMDTHGNPLRGASVVLSNVSTKTDSEGIAELHTYPLGLATITYKSRRVGEWVAGCGMYEAVIDLEPPKILKITNPKPGVITIEATDYSPMYVLVNGLGPFGPFNNSITLYLPGMGSGSVVVEVRDSFNNSVSVTAKYSPPRVSATADYGWLGLVSVSTVLLMYVGFRLVARIE